MGAQWKREKVQDHKFDFINVDDFIDNSCWRQLRYCLVFVAIMRGILVYCSDIFTAVNLLANKNPETFVGTKGVDFGGFTLPFTVYKYLFPACIIFGFLLLVLEVRRARNIVQSKDISYAFTSQMASRYYTVRSYPHYCFFSQINNSKKTVDEVAFFCFFTFRNWKRLMLADAPRQVINASILYQTFHKPEVQWDHPSTFFDWDKVLPNTSIFKKITLGAMIFTVVMFVLSLLMLIAAVLLYIPLVSHIQGNLKEYCCHKIDKRIEELIRKKTKSRAEAALRAGKKNNSKDIAMSNLQQPTLPQLDLLEDNKPLPTARNAYTAQTPASYNTPYAGNKGGGGYGQQQQQQQDFYDNNYGEYGDYGGDYGYNNTTNNNGYNTNAAATGYTQNYAKDDYFQAKSTPHRSATTTTSSGATTVVSKTPNGGIGYDPYSESAYTDDIYDHYNGKEEHQRLQQKAANDAYGDYYNATPVSNNNNNVGAYSQASQAAAPAPSSRTRRYDDYGHPQRSGSPLPSQHGSDLDSNHYGYDNSGTPRGGYPGAATNTNTGGAYGGYNNHNSADYYRSNSPVPGGGGRNNGSSQYQQQQQQYAPQTSPQQVPQRGRRQDTTPSNYRPGQGY